MDGEKDNIEGSDDRKNGNIDCTNEELVISDKSLDIPIPEASLPDENRENSERTTTIQATLPMPSTTETIPDRQAVNNLSFSSLSETKTTRRQGAAILEVAEQTTAYNVQVSSNNPVTLDVASLAPQPGQGQGSIVIEKPDQVIIRENINVKDSSNIQLGHNNVIGCAQTAESEGSALVGATAAAVSQPQLVIRQPGTVLLYSRKDIESCENVQIGDDNIMGKLMPQEDNFVKTCIKLGINPKQKEDIFERLGHEETREQFAAMMVEKCNVHCKLRNAGDGCILLELEVPTEEDRLQLLRMARDGTFQQVLLETFLPEFAAEGRAVNMNLAIGVRNPSQAMVEELQGAVASSDHEDVVVVEIRAADDPSASKPDQPESAEGQTSKQSDDTGDLAEGNKNLSGEEVPEVASSKPGLYTDDVPSLSKKLLPETEDEEGEIAVSVEDYAETVPLGTGAAAAADFPQEDFDDKFLTCDICHYIFDDPRILPCHHTFCARCLKQWCKGKSQFTCPTCRHQVSLQETGVGSLPSDFNKKKLLDFRASQKSKEAYACCQMCESGARVAGSCRDCPFFLCKNCITAHGKTPVLKDHNITLLDIPTEYCSKHTDQPMAFYCQPCDKLLCRDCIKTEHPPGPNHDPQEVSRAAQEVKTELQTLAGETQNKLKETDNFLRKDLICITTNCKLEKKRIQEHFVQLRAELDKEEQEMTNQLKKKEEEQKNPLLKEMKAFEGTSKSTEDGLTFCRDVLARGSDIEILTLGQQLKDNLNHLKSKKILHGRIRQHIEYRVTRGHPRGALQLYNKSIKVIELPIESLLTTISIIYKYDSRIRNSQATPQVTVVSPGGPDDGRFINLTELPEDQYATLETTRISEDEFEAVWRPQTSGKHKVGIPVREEGGENILYPNYRIVDVGSNNPVLRFGQKGSQQGQFDRPVDVAVCGDRLYVADAGNNRVQVFDLSAKFCFSFRTTTVPGSVAVQTDGTIVVKSGKEVMTFSPSGELLHRFSLDEYCTNPNGLTVQRDRRILVADSVKHSIFLFEADGTLVKQVGEKGEGEGQFDDPLFVCVDKEDNIIVSDKLNHRVQVFDRNLNFRHKFGQKGRQPQDMWGPNGVSADSRGNIILANIGEKSDIGGIEHNKKLQVFRPDGTWVSTISSDGDKLKVPCGVAVTEDGHVFVADAKDHCIRKYRYM